MVRQKRTARKRSTSRSRKQHTRKTSRRKNFRPAPIALKRTRRGALYRAWARFYGLYKTMIGKKKRFSFSIRISPKLSNQAVHRYIVIVCNALLNKEIPVHRMGDVFHSFRELIHKTEWVEVRKLLNYHAGVIYER